MHWYISTRSTCAVVEAQDIKSAIDAGREAIQLIVGAAFDPEILVARLATDADIQIHGVSK